MNHIPTLAETVTAVVLLVVALLVLRGIASWLVRSRELLWRVDELEALIRVMGVHLSVPLPEPARRKPLHARAAALYAQARALIR
jgi:hypothetical protein